MMDDFFCNLKRLYYRVTNNSWFNFNGFFYALLFAVVVIVAILYGVRSNCPEAADGKEDIVEICTTPPQLDVFSSPVPQCYGLIKQEPSRLPPFQYDDSSHCLGSRFLYCLDRSVNSALRASFVEDAYLSSFLSFCVVSYTFFTVNAISYNLLSSTTNSSEKTIFNNAYIVILPFSLSAVHGYVEMKGLEINDIFTKRDMLLVLSSGALLFVKLIL